MNNLEIMPEELSSWLGSGRQAGQGHLEFPYNIDLLEITFQ